MNIELGEKGMIRNGVEYKTYQLREGEIGTISISISKTSGRLDIDVYHIDHISDADYTGRDLCSSSFDVIVDKPGEYKIRISADDFVGDYGVLWKAEDDAGRNQRNGIPRP